MTAPELRRLLRDAEDARRMLEHCLCAAREVLAADRRSGRPAGLWRGKPHLAAAFQCLSAEAVRCAALASSIGLSVDGKGGDGWLEVAAQCMTLARAWRGYAGQLSGWGWRRGVARAFLRGAWRGPSFAVRGGGSP